MHPHPTHPPPMPAPPMPDAVRMEAVGVERAQFIQQESEQLYVVRHDPVAPNGRSVVLAGPMTLERSHGYLTWVRWARLLCAHGYTVFRFDYRGVGESTGSCAQQTLHTWLQDLLAVTRLAPRPVLTCGLRLGALLVHAAHAASAVDGALLWDPPVSGTAMLMEMLRRKIAADYMEHVGERKTREDYVRELRAGAVLEVEGYPWSATLWDSAEHFLVAPPAQPTQGWHAIHLDGRGADRLGANMESVRIPRPPFWLQSLNLVPDLQELFQHSLTRFEAWS